MAIKLPLIVCDRVVGCMSSMSCFMAAVPLNKSNCVPGGSNPEKDTYRMMTQNNQSKT